MQRTDDNKRLTTEYKRKKKKGLFSLRKKETIKVSSVTTTTTTTTSADTLATDEHFKMVLEHQGLPNFQSAGLQPALQLYAAAAAHLAPRNRGGVPPWAPFLQFGVPGVFGSTFFPRPRFGPTPNGANQATLASLSGLSAIGNSTALAQHNLNNNRTQGPPSECSNDDGGEYIHTN